MTTFFTADTHFGHEKIIAMAKRPFRDLDHMTREMIARWNAVVGPEDVVWHLGDFAYRMKPQPAIEILEVLNGTKHLVVGNHDHTKIQAGPWEAVWTNADVQIEGQRVFMSHYPHLEWPGYYHRSLHLFGHVHGNREGIPGSADVGVDCWDFTPASLAQVSERIGALV